LAWLRNFSEKPRYRDENMEKLTVKSPVFAHNTAIPKKYTCDGNGINPPLTIEGIPDQTKSLSLIMNDPDAPSGTFVHWIVWNIPPHGSKIGENMIPGVEGMNSAKRKGYASPCPPSGTHRYFFKVYALDTELSLAPNSSAGDLEIEMEGHILAKGEIIGLYRR
jgi:Raf kinase inhibitor-like YbhB/YbcL family protein